MTDNGGTAGVATFNAGLRAGKTTYYDGGHRVPCWIRWPAGKLGEPRDVSLPAQNTDLLPTLCELCGLDAAEVRGGGRSLPRDEPRVAAVGEGAEASRPQVRRAIRSDSREVRGLRRLGQVAARQR